MLHTPIRAHRRATTHLLLSVTLDTLPTRVTYYRHEVAPGHYLIVVRDGVTYGTLERAYIRRLPPWARRRIYYVMGVPDPVDHPRPVARWWDPEWPISPVSVRMLERAAPEGLITPWPHIWLPPPA